MIFQSYALWPHMTVAQNVAYGLRFKAGMCRARTAEQRVARDAPRRAARRLRGALSGRAERGPAAARGGGAGPGGRARDPAARRAALQPRRQPARGDALRDPPAPRGVRHHHALRHARSGRGHGHLRSHRRAAARSRGPDGHRRRALRPAAHALRRRVHRPHQPARRRGRRGRHGRGGPAPAARGQRRAGARRPGDRVDPAARDRADRRRCEHPGPGVQRAPRHGASARASSATAWTTRSRWPTATSCCGW